VVRAVVVLVLERAFVVGGEVVAATTRVLAGRGRDLDQISVAINQETPFFFCLHKYLISLTAPDSQAKE
jgi:hypothetical protein